jgi:alpha-mannosidase
MMKRRLLLALPLLLAVCLLVGHLWATQIRIYLAPDDHTDFIWSATEAQYTSAFLTMLDYYLAQADNTAGLPSPYQSRFNTDGSYWLWTYERNRTATFERLITRLKDGHISSPLTPLVCTYGGQPAEGVLRGMYYPGRLERRYGMRFFLAQAMENQTMPLGLGSLWAGAGAQYVWQGVCACDTQVPGLTSRQSEIYRWLGKDGSSVITKWFSFSGSNQSIGGYAEARDPGGAVDDLTSTAFASRYPFPLVAGAFGQGWDDVQTTNLDIQAAAEAMSNASQQVVVSNEVDYFRDFEATYGASPALGSYSASFGNEWDTHCASLAEVSARVKRAVERLRSAEALATLVSLQNPSFKRATADLAARDLAFLDMGLYFEHNFINGGPGASGSERIAWQRRLADEIDAYVNGLQADASAALGGLVQKAGTNTRFFAFNALSWMCTDFADLPYTGALPVHVVDVTTGQEVPSQIVSLGGAQYLRVMAPNVPAVGYKVFEIQLGPGQDLSDPALTVDARAGVIQNELYRVVVAPRGAITSLQDKTRGNLEFVQAVGGLAANDLGAGSGSLAAENVGPVSTTLTAAATSPLRHATRVTLYRGSSRIDIRNEVTQNPGNAPQSWAFGFNLASREVHHEEVGAILWARLKTTGGDYAPQNARYDWLTLNHFADVSGSGPVGVTLSNADAFFMRAGNSSATTLDETTPQISPLLGGQMDSAGIPNQGGDAFFLQRFALQTHGAFDALGAMRFALEHQNPLVTGLVTGGSAYPASSYSYLSVSNPNVLLWALKPAEEGIGEGVIVRLWNLGPSLANVSVTPASGLTRAVRTTHLETDLQGVSVAGGSLSASIPAQAIRTYRLRNDSAPPTTFFTVPPCRALDTRLPAGTFGGPALSPSNTRTFPLAGQCGIPSGASAVAANVTVTQPSGDGNLRLFAAGTVMPTTSVINFRAGQTRANNAIVGLDANGAFSAFCDSAGSANLVFDVNGYFQ